MNDKEMKEEEETRTVVFSNEGQMNTNQTGTMKYMK